MHDKDHSTSSNNIGTEPVTSAPQSDTSEQFQKLSVCCGCQ